LILFFRTAQVPPFLAYFGVATSDQSYLSEAYNQIKLYRNHLKSDSGAWKHIVLGDGQDPGLWNTGNGWAAYGSLRVLATMQNSEWAGEFTSEMGDLTAWVQEIVGAAFQKIKVSARDSRRRGLQAASPAARRDVHRN
jgi:rhamnogalacturonyl hydrolase YesR